MHRPDRPQREPERDAPLQGLVDWLTTRVARLSTQGGEWAQRLAAGVLDDLRAVSPRGAPQLAWAERGRERDDVGPVIVPFTAARGRGGPGRRQ